MIGDHVRGSTLALWAFVFTKDRTEVIWGLGSKPDTRNVAQLGSAPALGAGGRGFESRHSDDTDAETTVQQPTHKKTEG